MHIILWALGGYLVYRVFSDEPSRGIGIVPVELPGQLSKEQQEELEARVRAGDEAAFKKLATTNLPVIRNIAARVSKARGEQLDDLMLPAIDGYRRSILSNDPRAAGYIKMSLWKHREREYTKSRTILTDRSTVFLDAEPEEGERAFELPSTAGTPEELSDAKMEVLRRLAEMDSMDVKVRVALRQGREEFIGALMRRGMGSKAIAAELARAGLPMTQLSVRRAMVRMGADRGAGGKGPGTETESAARARQMLRSGAPLNVVVQRTGLSYNRVSHIRQAMGLGPGRGVKGSASKAAKVTEAQVRAMRAAHASGTTTLELAARYGLSFSSTRDIITRKTWRHLE